MAERLSSAPIKAIYSSPLERALETAGPLASRLSLQINQADELGELHVGPWQGVPFHELDKSSEWRRFNGYRSGVRRPEGELMIEAQIRMIRQLELIQQKHGGEGVAIVSHADPLRAVLAHFAGIPLDLALRLEISPASVSIVEMAEWSPRILCINATGAE